GGRPRVSLRSIQAAKLFTPVRQAVVRVRAGLSVVHDAVHFLAEGVNRVHRVASVWREEEERVVEVAPASLGKGGAVGLRFLARHAILRAPSGRRCPNRWGWNNAASSSTPSTRRGPGRLKYAGPSTA